MKILWDKKLIKLSNGSYIAWGIKRKKFFFSNKNELKLNCAIIEYYEQRERCDEKSTSDLKKIIAELKDKLNNLASVAEVRLANWQKYEKGLKEAKNLIRNLLRVTYGEGWNYSLDVKVKAEDFLKDGNNE